jgi:ABC-type phosphate transport system substrate-binding protein
MNTPRTKSIVTIALAVAALSAAPAAASVAEPPAATPGHDQQAGTVLHRDGSQAAPFVAALSPEASAATDDDGFNWGAAAIGAGAVLLAAALLMRGTSALGRRRTSQRAGAVSQGA